VIIQLYIIRQILYVQNAFLEATGKIGINYCNNSHFIRCIAFKKDFYTHKVCSIMYNFTITNQLLLTDTILQFIAKI